MSKLSITLFILGLTAISITAQDVNVLQSYAADTLSKWTSGWSTSTIPYVGVPSCLILFGSESYPVFKTDADRCGVFGAAVQAGQGRIAVFSHNGYPGVSTALNDNVRTWLAKGSFTNSQVLVLDSSIPENKFLNLDLSGYKFLSWTGPQDYSNSKSLTKIETYIRNGGGLLAAYPGWVLTAYNNFATVNDFSMNKLLNRFGILLTENYLSGNAPAPSSVPSVQNTNAFYAIQAGAVLPSQQSAVQQAVEQVPYQSLKAIDYVFQYLNAKAANLNYPVVNPDFNAKISAQFLAKKYDSPSNAKALKGIDVIPGVVTSTARVSATVTVVREVSDSWISTGYYLAAGEIVTITSLTDIQNWQVRIGCHSDNIAAKTTWPRAPSVTKQAKLASGAFQVTSPFGGLIYLVSSGSSCTTITVKLDNVVEAPFYDLNNPNSVWNVNAPGPIAEIQGKYLTMSIPTKYIADINDPASIANYWDKIILEDHNLRGTTATRRERFVADVEISAGYMHSGYPIMTYLDVVTPGVYSTVPYQLNLAGLTKEGSWGHFHEVGHNMQRGWWTFDGTGEVTNNVFSLLGGYVCCNLPVLQNPWLKDRVNSTLVELNSYISKSKDEAYVWIKADAGKFLVQYAFIQVYFGWDAYRKAFASYEATSGPRPDSNQDKIDTWVKQLSIACNRNLLPYYDMWRMPISDAGVASINALGLRPWLPGNNDYGISNVDQNYLNQLRTKYGL